MKALVSIISISSINYYLSFLSFFCRIYSSIILFLTDFISFSFLTTMIIILFAYFFNFFIYFHFHFFTFSLFHFFTFSLFHFLSFSLSLLVSYSSLLFFFLRLLDILPSYQQFWFRSFGFQSSEDLSFSRRKTMPRLVKISVRTYVRSYVINWTILCSVV